MSEARPVGDFIPGILRRAERIRFLVDFIGSLEEPSEQKEYIMRLHAGEIVTADTAQLLIEHFELESA